MHRGHLDTLHLPVELDAVRGLAGSEFDADLAVAADRVQHLVIDQEVRFAGISRIKRTHLETDLVGLARRKARNLAPNRPARRKRHVDAGMRCAQIGTTGGFDGFIAPLPALGHLEVFLENDLARFPGNGTRWRCAGSGSRRRRCLGLGLALRRLGRGWRRRRWRDPGDFLLVEFVERTRFARFAATLVRPGGVLPGFFVLFSLVVRAGLYTLGRFGLGCRLRAPIGQRFAFLALGARRADRRPERAVIDDQLLTAHVSAGQPEGFFLEPDRDLPRRLLIEETAAAQFGTEQPPPRRAARHVERVALARAHAGPGIEGDEGLHVVLRLIAAEDDRADQGKPHFLGGLLDFGRQFDQAADAPVREAQEHRRIRVEADLVIEDRLAHQAGHVRAHVAAYRKHADHRILGVQLGVKPHLAAHIEFGSSDGADQQRAPQRENGKSSEELTQDHGEASQANQGH